MERQWHIKGKIPHEVLEHFERMMATVAWEPIEGISAQEIDDIPTATHHGTVYLPPPFPNLSVVQLSDGRRLIVEASMRALLATLGIDVV